MLRRSYSSQSFEQYLWTKTCRIISLWPTRISGFGAEKDLKRSPRPASGMTMSIPSISENTSVMFGKIYFTVSTRTSRYYNSTNCWWHYFDPEVPSASETCDVTCSTWHIINNLWRYWYLMFSEENIFNISTWNFQSSWRCNLRVLSCGLISDDSVPLSYQPTSSVKTNLVL